MKEWSEHEIKVVFELSSLLKTHVGIIYELDFLNFYIFLSYLPDWGGNSRFVVDCEWLYSPLISMVED